MGASSTDLLATVRTTINDLQNAIKEIADKAIIVAEVHREALSKLRSQLEILENCHSSIKTSAENHAREVAIIMEKTNSVAIRESTLKIDDRDETIYLLCQTMKDLQAQYVITQQASEEANKNEEARAQDLVGRARALFACAKESADLEGAIRGAFETEIKQRHRDETATNLLQDGILVWACRTNQFAILMTECLLQVHDHQLEIAPTQLSFDSQFLRSLNEEYCLDYASTDLDKHGIVVNLHNVEEIRFMKRRAIIPGSSDDKGPHWEPPKYHQCVYIRTRAGKEYFLADRRNEPRDRTWAGLQDAPGGSPSLLCRKLTSIWQDVKNARP